MRFSLLIAAAVALSACGNKDQADNTQNVDENLSAESIVSNDVTAIDAVTGDAANMAADVDTNFANPDENAGDATTNAPAATQRPSVRKKTAPAPAEASPANSAANSAATATNAE